MACMTQRQREDVEQEKLRRAHFARLDSNGFTLSGTKSLVCPGTTTFNTVAYTWPAADGTTGQDLNTNGSGTLSWA